MIFKSLILARYSMMKKILDGATMKRLILSIIILFILLTNLNGQWEILNEGVDEDIYDIDFANENVGWIACFNTLLNTKDSGETWRTIYLDEKWRIFHI